MDYFILCFGRTDFTQHTINSIIDNASSTPKIYLINNGWNKQIIPSKILNYWENFCEENIKNGKIHEIIDMGNCTKDFALDAFSIATEISKDDYFWITDNDCIIGTKGFDRTAVNLMEKYRELPKLGIDFYRAVSLQHCRKFSAYIPTLDDYLSGSDYRIVEPGQERQYYQEVKENKMFYRDDSKISSNLSDTTLSVVRKGVQVTQKQNRISYSIEAMDMLHIGYLEPIFFSKNSNSVLEMIHYMNIRPSILTEWTTAYAERRDQYINNLIKNGKMGFIEEYLDVAGS